MAKYVKVRYGNGIKNYCNIPEGAVLYVDDNVIAETIRGIEYGTVLQLLDELPEEGVKNVYNIVRMATEDDIETIRDNESRAEGAFGICEEKIKKHDLKMKLIKAEYTFDRGKLLFSFSAEKRVDFRALVKDLAAEFHTRIELRQIGVRDEARLLGGLAICGRPYCCESFLDDFQPVSIKMAKEQHLSLNPVKISGNCGRLMCCLKYEQDIYEELLSELPPVKTPVVTPDGNGIIADYNVIGGKVLVELDLGDGDKSLPPRYYNIDEVSLPAEEGEKHSKRRKERQPKRDYDRKNGQ